jgi:hypothetical protein
MKYLAFVFPILIAVLVPAIAGTPTQFVLYKSGALAIPAPATANKWFAPGNAFTSVTILAPFNQWKAQGASILKATAQVVWSTKSPATIGYTDVGIFVCPFQNNEATTGLVGCTLLTYFAGNDHVSPDTPGCADNPGGPMPCFADVTSILQIFLANGTPNVQFTLGTQGNGSNGPDVYDAELMIVWGP